MSDLKVRIDGGALWLTLNRPDQFNALTGEMVIALIGELRGAVARDDVRVVVLTGTGAAFSAGAASGGENPHEKYASAGADGATLLVRGFIDLEKPVVCGLN